MIPLHSEGAPMKERFPVYDICKLNKGDLAANNEILADHLSVYLNKHYSNIHTAHRHSFFHFVVFTKGKGTHTIDFTRYEVKPFQAYFMLPGQVHSWDFKSMPEGYIVNFSENFFNSFLANPRYLEKFNFFSGINDECVYALPASIRKECIQLLEELIRCLNSAQPHHLDLAKMQLLELFMLIDNAIGKESKNVITQQKHALLISFKHLVESNYRTLRLPKDYAELLYVTPNHLNALCQDLVGKTAGELIRERVLLEAKRLLTNADMTIAELSIELNFQDNSYFNRFFKKYTGMTPDNFRKQLQPKN